MKIILLVFFKTGRHFAKEKSYILRLNTSVSLLCDKKNKGTNATFIIHVDTFFKWGLILSDENGTHIREM